MFSEAQQKLKIWLHFGFILTGVITVILGQILPILIKYLSLTDNQAGYLFIAQFSGSLGGVFLYNFLIKKIGFLKTIFSGFCLIACGCLGLNLNSYELIVPAIILYGVGIGVSLPTINMLVVELNPESSSSSLNLLNFFWGIGAILTKPFIDFAGTGTSYFLPTLILSAGFLLTAFLILFSQFKQNSPYQEERLTPAGGKPIWTTGIAWMIAVFNFVNIGIESSVGGWITTFETRFAEGSPFLWLSAASVFFLFMVVGRGIAPIFLKLLSDNSLLIVNTILMTLGSLLILQAASFMVLLLGVSLIGIGTSSLFPTNMSRFTKIFGAESSRNAAPIFIFGNLGGAFMTWFVGFLSTFYKDLRIGFFAIVGSCLILIVLQIIISQSQFSKGTK